MKEMTPRNQKEQESQIPRMEERPAILRVLVRAVKITDIVLVLGGLIGMWASFANHVIVLGAFWLVIFAASTIYLLDGIGVIHTMQRRVYEVLGRTYEVYREGVHWFPRWLMCEKARITVNQQEMALYPETVKIDLPDGYLNPNGAVLLFHIEDTDEAILKSVYAAKQTKERAKAKKPPFGSIVKKRIETMIRTFLNPKSSKEILEFQQGGYDIVKSMGLSDKYQGSKRARDAIKHEKAILASFGLAIDGIVIPDYGLSSKMTQAREELAQAKTGEQAAEFKARKMAIETATSHGEVVKTLMETYNFEEEQAHQLAEHYITYFKGADTGSLVDWRGGTDRGLLELVAQAGKAIAKAQQGGKDG